jgi:hypothetical protein
MRRDVGRHAHGDAAGAVDEQVWRAGGQVLGLLRGVVVVGAEVDRVLLEFVEQLFGEGGQARLGVTHRCRRVVIYRAEVALAVNEHGAHRKRLRHANERVVDRRIAMRVVVAHHFADDLGGLAVTAVRAQSGLEHAVQDASLHGLQAVAHIGQRASDDDAHGVVEIRLLHLDFDVDGNQVLGWAVSAAAQRQPGRT